MERFVLATERLCLRPFQKSDIPKIYELYSDAEVNTFLPWFPIDSYEQAEAIYEQYQKSIQEQNRICFCMALKDSDEKIGYIHVSCEDSHDLGYAVLKDKQNRGYASEAVSEVLAYLKESGFDYVTATHDQNNPASGQVMRKCRMKYAYSYEEMWQPKNFAVVFDMYQINFDSSDFVYMKYWNQSENHWIEKK